MTQTTREKAYEIFHLLEKQYPHAKTVLTYSTPWELLFAVMLSAQCTDVAVNKATEHLFKKYKTVNEYADADLSELEQELKSIIFYRNKARNIKAAAKIIVDTYAGKVPDTMEGLIQLPGVARKTANIVLGNVYHKYEGIAVDTHVKRLSQLYGFTTQTDPIKIEQELMHLFDPQDWFKVTYLLIEQGRHVDTARFSKKELCIIEPILPHHAV